MWCNAPFASLTLTDGRSTPCCIFPIGIRGDEAINQLRKDFLNHNPPEICRTCKVRDGYNKMKVDQRNLLNLDPETGEIKDFKATDIHFKIGQRCNSICRTCRGSLNIDEEEDLSKGAVVRELIQSRDSLKSVVILGGETFMYKEVLLEALRHIPMGVKVITFTNGSICDEEILRALAEKNVHLNISIDGDLNTNHYMRVGMKLDHIKRLVDKVKAYNIDFTIIHTLSIANILDVHRNIRNISKYLNVDYNNFTLNFVIQPKSHCISTLPDDLKEIAMQELINVGSDYGLFVDGGVRLLVTKSQILFTEYCDELLSFDKVHGLDSVTHLNDMLIKSIKENQNVS